MGIKIMDRDRHLQLKVHHNRTLKEEKEKELFKNLRTEVNAGANGTQDYIIKKVQNTVNISYKGK